MKLIIREYLQSLREREELDAVLPDLLSQMELNVFSRPGRGTRQDGVDVGAVGRIDGGPEKVYLVTIKPGNLTLAGWDTDVQSVRQSLDEILDAYIRNRLPSEHRDKPIVIVICCGGDILEPVRPSLEGFIDKYTTDSISFEKWNGDWLASRIQNSFLREELLPKEARTSLRKSLALIDEPEASYRHFSDLIKSFSVVEGSPDVERLTAIRQMSICLWILFSWAREAENTESSYLAGELTLLHGWAIVRLSVGQKRSKAAKDIDAAFFAIFYTYQRICTHFLATNVLPHVDKLHALTSAVRASGNLDVTLKMFDLVGRLGMDGLWAYWGAKGCGDEERDRQVQLMNESRMYADAVKALVSNNPALLLPIKDEQSIDICMAVSLLSLDSRNRNDITRWLSEIIERAEFAYLANLRYPCTIDSYSELLEHPQKTAGYRESVTGGSVLYPMISFWAALFSDDGLYARVSQFKKKHLQHCNFQLFYPDELSEAHIYKDDGRHGAVLSNTCVGKSKEDFLDEVFGECEQSPQFKELSAVQCNWWPLIIVACRHHRLPLPLHLFEALRPNQSANVTKALSKPESTEPVSVNAALVGPEAK